MTGQLHYASHLGYRPPMEPLFMALVGGLDLQAHIGLAAHLGFSAVLYPWATGRPANEVAQVIDALARHSLRGGCVVYAPMDVVLKPYWVSRDPLDRRYLLEQLAATATLGQRLMSRVVAVLVQGDPNRSYREQRTALIENLKAGADIVVKREAVLGIEPMNALPGMLLPSFAEALDVVRAVGHPGVKLIFDTGHLWAMGDPIIESLISGFADICTIQLADQPGRCEPGSGEIDFVPLLTHALRMGFNGLVELQHGWARPGRQSEGKGYMYLKELDLLARLGADQTT